MQQFYAIYGTVKLVDEPNWLKKFRMMYDQPFDFHITLKQSAFINVTDLQKIKETLEAILKDLYPVQSMNLVFDRLELDEHDADSGFGWIYLFATKRNNQLDDLQKHLREKLAEFSDYRSKESKEYEYNFRPHITIARELDSNKYECAVKELPGRAAVTGRVTDVTLLCVSEASPEQAKNSNNLTRYQL